MKIIIIIILFAIQTFCLGAETKSMIDGDYKNTKFWSIPVIALMFPIVLLVII